MTIGAQIAKLKERFGLSRVVLVGDRGMITQARLDGELKPAGLDWITALRSSAIRELLDAGAFQLDLFGDRDMAVITSPDYPGERLMVCRNPELAHRRARKREELLAATEADLEAIRQRERRLRAPLRGKAEIGLKIGEVQGRHKMAEHFELTIGEDDFSFHRKHDAIASEAALDGLYVVRTNLPADVRGDAQTAEPRLDAAQRKYVFTLYPRPTPTQKRAFELLPINPHCTQQTTRRRTQYKRYQYLMCPQSGKLSLSFERSQ